MGKRNGRRALVIAMVVVLLAGMGLTAFAARTAGDVNGDGKITVFDAQMLAEAQAGRRTLSAQQQSAAEGYTLQNILDIVLGRQEMPETISCFRPYAGGTLGNMDGYVWDSALEAYVTKSGTDGNATYAPDGLTPLSGDYAFSADVTLPELVAEGGFYLSAYVDADTQLRYGVEAQADGSLVLFSDYQDGSDNNNRIDHQTIAEPTFPMNLGVIVNGDHMAMTLNDALVYDRAVKGVADSNLVISGSKMMVAQLKNIVAEDDDAAVATAYATATSGYQHALVGLLTQMPPEPVMKQSATESYFVNGYSRVTQKPDTNFVRAVHMNYSSTNPIGMEFYKDGNVLDGNAWALSMDLTMKVDGDKTRTGSMTFHITKDGDNGAGFKFIRDMDGINGIRRFIFRDGTRLQSSGDEVIKDLAVAANWTGKVTFMFYNKVIYLFVQQPDRSEYELISSYPVDWDRCSPQLEVFQYMSVEMANLSMTNDAAEVAQLHNLLAKPQNPIDTAKILFLGNSCTFYYDMPNVLARLAKNAGYYVEVNTVARSSSRMDMFTKTTDYLYTLSQAEMAREDYDLVFIQGLSSDTDTESNQQRAITGATDLAALIRSVGETPAMFVRPSRKLRDMDGDDTLETFVVYTDSKAYEELFGGIAKDLNMDAYYVNRAFALAYQENNDVDLWYSDDAHSNARGAYLTACVLFATYFNTSCENVGDDGLPAADAAFLREIADRVVLQGEMPNWD